MAATLIASIRKDNVASATTLDQTTTLNIAAGDLLVAWVKYEGGAATTVAVASVSGSPANAFTVNAGDTVAHGNNDLHTAFGYVLNASADASCTLRLTLGAARVYRALQVYQFRPDGGETWTRNAGAIAASSSNSTAPSSGNFSPTGSDLVVVGGYGDYSGSTFSVPLINSVAADGQLTGEQTLTASWYRILTTGFTNGTASCTLSGSAAWTCGGIAFASASGGGGATPHGPFGLALNGPFGRVFG